MLSISTAIESVLDEENILKAIIHLQDSKCKNDQSGLNPSLLMEYWKNNKESIVDSIHNKKYALFPVKQYEKLSKSGKKRTISVISLADRLIARAIQQSITQEIDTHLSSRCFSYRNGLGAKNLVEFAVEKIKDGYDWVLELDIKDFFDSIPRERLLKILEEIIIDEKLYSLIVKFINCPIDKDGTIVSNNNGILQGVAFSPLLSNIYLLELDKQFEILYPGYCRYGDDIKILSKSKNELEGAFQKLTNEITNLGLSINKKKMGIYPSLSRKYLGYELKKNDENILLCPITYNDYDVYNKWQTCEIKEIENHYHIISDGVISKRNFTLLFENDNVKKYIPIEKIDTLSIYSNVIFNTNFFEYISSERIIVNIVDQYGNILGNYIPIKQRRNIKTEISQLNILNDEKKRLLLAKELEKAYLFNLRATLRYYKRREENNQIDIVVSKITEIIEKINTTKTIDSLMMYEARARQMYYQCFNVILNDSNFKFSVRTKRPPKDAINSLISYGNTLLYSRLSLEIRKTDLDIRFGIIHSAYKRNENLNLDIADIFKPIIVDRIIFTLINKNMINITDFEENANGGIYISNNAKRIVIREFNRKLSSKLNINGKYITYSSLLSNEIKKIRNYFVKNDKYKAYKYVN